MILENGICVCDRAPMGEHGLEGYAINCNYYFEYCREEDGKEYCRMFPVVDKERYYECCGPIVFNKYFTAIIRVKSKKKKGEKNGHN